MHCILQVGCRYLKGEWSPHCDSDGLRTRVDSLVGKVLAENVAPTQVSCEQTRVVRKKCERSCHYTKTGKLSSAELRFASGLD